MHAAAGATDYHSHIAASHRPAPLMHEDYRFLDLNGEHVFAGYHRPDEAPSRAVVMCHPMGEEKLWAHRVFVSLARELAAAGFAVLRFDFRGEGDSSREFDESDLETRIEDTHLAIETVRAWNPSVTNITLLGLRMGALVAAVTATRRYDVSRLVLWDSILDGAAHMQTVLRVNLMYQMAVHRRVIETRDLLASRLANGGTVNIEGYELGGRLFRQVSDFRLADVLPHYSGRTLLVQIDPAEATPKPELQALATHERIQVALVKEEPFWREIKTYYQQAPELARITLDGLEAAT